jgi:uncharacterized protein (DUF2141 family)
LQFGPKILQFGNFNFLQAYHAGIFESKFKKHFIMKTLLIISIQLLFVVTTYAQKGNLTVTYENPGEKKGMVYVGVFTEKNFLMNPTSAAAINLDEGQASVTIEGLEYGAYAVSIYHDANGNETLDMDEYGRPTEPWGLSGASAGMMPMWSEAKFEVNSETKEVKIKM